MKRILAAVDGTEISRQVVARAVEVARATGGKIRLLHAIPIPTPVPHPGMFLPLPMDSSFSSEAAVLHGLVEQIPEAMRDGEVIELGNATDVVCGTARSYGAELVVIGAHRYGVLSRVLGTTAGRIVNKIDRPILVVRPMLPAVSVAAPGQVLRHEHRQLEGVYARLIAAYRGGDWSEVRAQWDAFDLALRAHMQTEETDVLPAFQGVDANAAAELRAEHDELRKILEALGVRVDLHSLVIDDAERLIDRIRAHAAREEKLLYPWVDESLAAETFHDPSPAAHSSFRDARG